MILKYFLSWFFSVGEFLEHRNLKTTEPEPEPKIYLLTTTQYGDFEHSSKYGVLLSASLFSEKQTCLNLMSLGYSPNTNSEEF